MNYTDLEVALLSVGLPRSGLKLYKYARVLVDGVELKELSLPAYSFRALSHPVGYNGVVHFTLSPEKT